MLTADWVSLPEIPQTVPFNDLPLYKLYKLVGIQGTIAPGLTSVACTYKKKVLISEVSVYSNRSLSETYIL